MKRVLLAAMAAMCLVSPSSAAEFLTMRSPDILISVARDSRGTAQISTKDGREVYFGFGINRKTWDVDAIVMIVGGFLGIGSKCVAVKPNFVQFIEQHITIDITLDELKKAPKFADSC